MTWCIAHRGEPRGFRENTLPAIAAGVAAGADLVEVDVRLTADGEAILLHDETLERLWGDPRPVDSLTLAEIRSVSKRSTDWAIPTLGEALDVAEELDTTLVLDVTSVPIGLAALSVVRRKPRLREVVYCGDAAALAAIRERSGSARIALSWGNGPLPGDDVWTAVRPQFFNPKWTALTPEVVDRMHADGRRVWTWTVDEPMQMARLMEIGVDAIVSTEIAALIEIVKRPLLLEPARPSDAEPLAALRDDTAHWLAQRGFEQWQPGEFDAGQFEKSIELGEVFVFRAGGLLIATVTLCEEDDLIWPDHDHADALYVHRLIVRRSHHGRGLGKEVLTTAERMAKARGRRVLRLDCAASNPQLREYYLRQGYRDVTCREFPAEPGYRGNRLFEKRLLP